MDRFFGRGYSLLHQNEQKKSLKDVRKRLIRTHLAFFAANTIMFLVSLAVLSIWLHERYFVLNNKLRQTSTWSMLFLYCDQGRFHAHIILLGPIHDLVDLDMKPRLVDGTIFPGDNPSIARQMPNPSADTEWQIWDHARMIPITKADIIRLGKNPDTAFKLVNDIWGLGDDAYAAHLDVFHQLHCLNTLRKIAYGKYYNASMGNHDKEGIYEVHLNHCVDILMQALQCSGNVNLITLHWYETQPSPNPDFSANRQCVAFDRLTLWNSENSINRQEYLDLDVKIPEGQLMEEAPSKMREWAHKHAGEWNEDHHM
jgi:hypothetical protein